MKKDCLHEQILWEYLDEEIDKPTLSQIEKHLEKCPCCQKALQELKGFDAHFSNVIQYCHEKKSSNPKTQKAEMPESIYSQHKGLIWMILPPLVMFSMFSALLFVAIIAPDISALPFSGEFKYIKSLSYKFIEIFFNSSLLIGFIFLGLFVWNMFFNRNTA